MARTRHTEREAGVGADPTRVAEPSETELRRTLNTRDVALLSVGLVIGSGIFLVPGAVLRQVGGDVGIALLVWTVGGVLTLLGALTYGELAAMMPEAGGVYVFIRDAFGRFPAFLFGWTLFLVIAAGAVATLSVAFATYLGEIVALGPLAAKAVSLSMIAVVMAINVLGTRRSAGVQNVSTAIKVLAIVAMGALFIALGDGWTRPGTVMLRDAADRVAALRPRPGDDRRAVGVRGVAVRDLHGRRGQRAAAHLPARHRDRHGGADRHLRARQRRIRRGDRRGRESRGRTASRRSRRPPCSGHSRGDSSRCRSSSRSTRPHTRSR